jgi:hypothetical protein
MIPPDTANDLTDLYLAFLSVFVATVLTMITVGVETKGHVVNEVTTEVTFREGFLAVTNIIFAYRMWNIEHQMMFSIVVES